MSKKQKLEMTWLSIRDYGMPDVEGGSYLFMYEDGSNVIIHNYRQPVNLCLRGELPILWTDAPDLTAFINPKVVEETQLIWYCGSTPPTQYGKYLVKLVEKRTLSHIADTKFIYYHTQDKKWIELHSNYEVYKWAKVD